MDSLDNIELIIINEKTTNISQIPIPNSINRNILFCIREYNTAKIKNNSENYNIYIENLDEGEEIKLSHGEEALINNNDHPYPPMEYRLKVENKTTGKISLYLYKIEHTNSTSDFQYKEMISAIGEYDENLLYDSDAKYISGKRIYNSTHKSFFACLDLLSKSKEQILNSLNIISNNPVHKDVKELVKTNIEKKQSSRSIIRNARAINERTIYSSKLEKNADFGLNQYLVFMVKFSEIQLIELENKAKNELNKTKEKLDKLIKNIDPNPKKRKKHTNYQIEKLNKKVEFFDTFVKDSSLILGFIKKILNLDCFKRIKYSSKRYSGISYYLPYLTIERKLFLPLFQTYGFDFASNFNTILSSPIKQTSKLFEAYCLVILDSAIKELGFESIKDEIDYDHIIKRFTRDDYEVEIIYEISAKDVSIASEGDVYYINSNTKHVSPDFSLILKKNNIPICFILFDAKCRKIKRVHQDIVEKKYEETIREYLSLRYSTNENPFLFPKIVDSLWLLMPEDGDDFEYNSINKLEYRMTKLLIDGNEDNFIAILGSYLSIFLD